MSALEGQRSPGGRAVPWIGGCLAAGLLNFVASAAIVVLGTLILGPGGGLLVLPFWTLLALLQWIYVAPAAILAKRWGFAAVGKGIWLGGWLVVACSLLYWGGLGVMNLADQRKVEEIRRYDLEHPLIAREISGTIAAADTKHIEVRTAEGVVSIGLEPSTYYHLARGPHDETLASPDIVRVGAEVVVEARSLDGGPLCADHVTVEASEAPGSPPSDEGIPPGR